MLASTESTVYPLLRRLLKENYLEAFWKDSVEGLPPRKYYSLTSLGEEYVTLMSEEWEKLLQAIISLKGEDQ
jgi:PadR family transcriptional regulator PadR